MPVLTLPRLLLSLVSLAILAGGAYLLWSWYHGYEVRDAYGVWRRVHGPAWRLPVGGVMFAWSFLGRFVVLPLVGRHGDDPALTRGEPRELVAPDGSRLNVEISGRPDGPTLILTHGWGLDSTAWSWARRDLGRRFRLVTWDLPGLGRSSRPGDKRYSIDGFAEDLAAVIEQTTDRPAILVGHSIGGMTVQTLFRVRPDLARSSVAGVVLLNTTYDNPLRTMIWSRLWLALQKPLLEPMCWLTVALSPLVWLSNWQSYLSGSSQLAMRIAGFGRYATRGQVDAMARLAAKGSPAVQAKGNLAMFHWQAREVLRSIPVPTLVIAGDHDIVTLPEAGEVIAARAPRAELERVGGVGHMGFVERAGDYNASIADFAERALLLPLHAVPTGETAPNPSRGARRQPPDEHRVH